MKLVDVNEQQPIVQKNVEIVKDIDFWPIEDLPSKYHFYAPGTKIFGRCLKVPEVKKLGLMNADNEEYIIQSVLSNAIKGIDINDLLVVDKFFIILWLRANTYKEPGYSINFLCDKCKEISSYDFELSNLSVKYFDETFNPNFELANGKKLTLKFQTLKDDIALTQFKKTDKYKSLNTEEDEDFDLVDNIDTINDKQLNIIEKYNFLMNELTPIEYSKLKGYISKYDFGVKTMLSVKCKKCEGISQVGVTFQRQFFLPDYKLG